MATKQLLNSVYSPDGSLYVTLTDGNGNLVASSALSDVLFGVSQASVVAPGIGAVPGDVLTPTGGTVQTLSGYLGTPNLVIAQTQVVSATVAAAGTYTGSTGNITVTGTTGTVGSTGRFTANVAATNGVGITAVNSITVGGDYSVNPTSLTNEPVTGATLTGAQLSLVMGALSIYVQQSGSYSTAPSITANPQATTSGAGSGVTLNLLVLPLAAGVAPGVYATDAPGTLGDNVVYGTRAGISLTSGVENTLFGPNAGAALTTGGFNTFVGTSSGIFITTQSNNVAVGNDTFRNGINIANSIAIGSGALKNWIPSGTAQGNVAIGFSAMVNWTSNNGAPLNTVIGYNAGNAATASFLQCTVIGGSAGSKLTSGSTNTILGYLVASTTLTTGSRNILIGTAANTDTAASGTNDSFVIGASTGATPWLTGSLVAASMTATFGGSLTTTSAAQILGSATTITGGSTGNVPTLTSGPVTGNPTKWLPYNDNGTTRYIPSW